MSDVERDVEKGSVEESTTNSSLTPEDEKSHGYYQKTEEMVVKQQNLNVPGSEDDLKVPEKKMDMEASRSDNTHKRSNLERAAESSELEKRSHGGESSEASESSRSRDSITECQLAPRIDQTTVENAMEELNACRSLMGIIDEAIDVIQGQVDDFTEKAENDETGNMTQADLVIILRSVEEVGHHCRYLDKRIKHVLSMFETMS